MELRASLLAKITLLCKLRETEVPGKSRTLSRSAQPASDRTNDGLSSAIFSFATFSTTALLASSSGLGLALGLKGHKDTQSHWKQEADTMATFTLIRYKFQCLSGPAQHGYQRPVDKRCGLEQHQGPAP